MEHLDQYIARSPRFILSPEDHTLIRLSGPQQTPWEEPTEIYDFSYSGLSFTAPKELTPKVKEVIKVQFSPPGQKEMACYARVTRVESRGKSEVLVGIEFFDLNQIQRLLVARGVAYKLVQDWNELKKNSPIQFFWKAVLYRFSKKKTFGLILIAIGILWLAALFLLLSS